MLCKGRCLNGKVLGRPPFPWCCKSKLGRWNSFCIDCHLSVELQCSFTGRGHLVVGLDPLRQRSTVPGIVGDDHTLWILGGRNTAPDWLKDLDHRMRSPGQRSTAGADAKIQRTRMIKRGENPAQISWRPCVRQ